MAIANAIRSAAGFGRIEATDVFAQLRFPRELSGLSLNVLLALILLLGTLRVKHVLKQTSVMLTSLSEAKTLCWRAGLLLRDWPAQLNRLLETMQAHSTSPSNLSLKHAFGPLYLYWLSSRRNPDLSFFIQAFENWVQERWLGLIRGQNTAFASNLRDHLRWMPAPEAAKQANLVIWQIKELVRQQVIKGVLIGSPESSRSECWVHRQSLADWTAQRDQKLAGYMTAKEVRCALGLSSLTLKTVAATGIIRWAQGCEKWYPDNGPYYERADVEAIQQAFENHDGHCGATAMNDLIQLRSVIRLHCGRRGLARIIEAVKNGQLIPAGKVDGSTGLGGYLFVKAAIAAYYPPRQLSAIPGDLIGCGDAARLLETNSEVVRNLVRNRRFFSPPVLLNGRKLIRKIELERFARDFISLASIARRYRTRSRAITRQLARHGVMVLSVKLPGKGIKLFVSRDVVLSRRWDLQT
jgi:hypothetical protein